jgi:hypothetical protein
MAQKNPFVILGLPADLVDQLLPHTILILANARCRTLSSFYHPDKDPSKRAARRFKALQEAIEELQIEERFFSWKERYLRAAARCETTREEREQAEALAALRHEVTNVHDALSQLLVAGCVERWSFYDTEKALTISAVNPPACRILLGKGNIFATRRRINCELVLKPDGTMTRFRVERRKFYVRDGVPPGVPEAWMHRHASGPNYVSRYWHRLDETAQPFEYRLLGGIRKYAKVFEGWWDIPSSVPVDADEEPSVVDDDLGEGIAWEHLVDHVHFLGTNVRHARALVLTRLVEGVPRFWLIGPVTAVDLL